MNNLVVIEKGLIPIYQNEKAEQLVNARELYGFLETSTRYNDWIKSKMRKYGFLEDVDYITLTENLVRGGKQNIHIFKLDAAKEIAMVENNEKGSQVRKYFIDIEKKYKQQGLTINALSPQLQLLICIELRQQKIEAELQETQKQTNEIQQSIQNIKDTIVINPADNWRKGTNDILGKVCEKIKDYKTPKEEVYKALSDRAKCSLKIRLVNLKGRALMKGMAKSQIDKLNYLDVIANDARLKEIYIAIVKEVAVKNI